MKSKLFVLFLIIASILNAADPYTKVVVAQDGSGDFTSIQKAIDSLRDLGPGEALVYIKAGTYHEKIEIRSSKHHITIQGENRENTIITHDDYSGKIDECTQEKMTTFNSYTFLVVGDDIKIENITIQNSSCNQGQAVALHVEGDRFIMKNSNILGCQDTLYTATNQSRQYYENCHIEGTTDFIFGQATVVFQNCTIKNLTDSYSTAAATDKENPYGYVFFDCELIAKEGVTKAYLGRPWRPYAKTVFITSNIGKHIVPEGWHAWPGDKMFPDKEKTAYYAEFNNQGEGAEHSKRVTWSHQLTKKEAKKYTLENIFRGWIPN